MDVLGLLAVPDWVLWLAGITMLLYIYGMWPVWKAERLGQPGPPLKPFVGSMIDMFSYPKPPGDYYLDLKRKYGTLFRLLDMRLPVLAVCDLDIIKAITVKEHNSFTDRRSLPNRGILIHSLLDRKGDTWKENRSLITPFFTSGKLKFNFGVIKKCCDNMIKHMKLACEENKIIEMKTYTGTYTMDVICAAGFGLDVDSASDPNHPFIVHAKGITDISFSAIPTVIAMMFPFIGKIMNKCGVQMLPADMVDFFSKATSEAIELRKKSAQRRPDFIDAMIRAHEDELSAETQQDSGASGEKVEKMKRKGLTREEIIANGILLFLAGFDTTATTLSFLMYTLAHHPEWQDKCVEEIKEVIGEGDIDYESVKKLDCINMCLQETERIFPVAFATERVANKNMNINGLTIPEGTCCVIPIWALHRDPGFWPEPEKFDPLRFTQEAKQGRNPYCYLPFGTGPRNCIGMRLALLEIKLAAVKILQNFRILPDGKTNFPPEISKSSILVKAEKGLWVKLAPR